MSSIARILFYSMLLTANHAFPPRLFSVYTCDRYHCTHDDSNREAELSDKRKTTTPQCCALPFVADFIVVRQPQVHTPCTSSDFRCQPHQQDVARFPTQDCLSTTKTNSISVATIEWVFNLHSYLSDRFNVSIPTFIKV